MTYRMGWIICYNSFEAKSLCLCNVWFCNLELFNVVVYLCVPRRKFACVVVGAVCSELFAVASTMMRKV